MAGQKITIRKGTILQEELDSIARTANGLRCAANELRWGGRAIKVAAEIAKPSPDFNRTVPMQRLAMAAAGKDTLIPLLEGEAWPDHIRRMNIETLLIGYMLQSTGYSASGLKGHAERHLKSLAHDLRNAADAERQITPIRVLIAEGCMDDVNAATKAGTAAKARVEALMARIILAECPDIVIVREYLADAKMEGYTNLEL